MIQEYDAIYKNFYGFEFICYKHGVGKSKSLSFDEVEKIPSNKGNGDETPIFVKCKNCGEYMNYFNGYFNCEKCSRRIKEGTLFSQLEKENKEFEDNDYEEYWD